MFRNVGTSHEKGGFYEKTGFYHSCRIACSKPYCLPGGKTETPATTAAGETSAATEAASTAGGDNTAVSPDNDFVIALQADATHLDPHVSGNGVSNTITNSMYETLVWFDENLELKPLLAKSWTVSDDGLDYICSQ